MHETRSRRKRIEDVLKSWPDKSTWSAIASCDFPRIQALADTASTSTELGTATLIINHFMQVGDLVAKHDAYAGAHIRDVARRALATIKRKQWTSLNVTHYWDRWEIVPPTQEPKSVERWTYWAIAGGLVAVVMLTLLGRRGDRSNRLA